MKVRTSTLSFAEWSLALLLISACDTNDDNDSSPTMTGIDISPTPCAVSQAAAIQLTATVTQPGGTKLDVTRFGEWSSANTNTVTVDASGKVIGVSVGVTSITITYRDTSNSQQCSVVP